MVFGRSKKAKFSHTPVTKDQLTGFYLRHDPSKVGNIDYIFSNFEPPQIIAQLVSKYGADAVSQDLRVASPKAHASNRAAPSSRNAQPQPPSNARQHVSFASPTRNYQAKTNYSHGEASNAAAAAVIHAGGSKDESAKSAGAAAAALTLLQGGSSADAAAAAAKAAKSAGGSNIAVAQASGCAAAGHGHNDESYDALAEAGTSAAMHVLVHSNDPEEAGRRAAQAVVTAQHHGELHQYFEKHNEPPPGWKLELGQDDQLVFSRIGEEAETVPFGQDNDFLAKEQLHASRVIQREAKRYIKGRRRRRRNRAKMTAVGATALAQSRSRHLKIKQQKVVVIIQRSIRSWQARKHLQHAREQRLRTQENKLYPMPGTHMGKSGWYQSRNYVYKFAVDLSRDMKKGDYATFLDGASKGQSCQIIKNKDRKGKFKVKLMVGGKEEIAAEKTLKKEKWHIMEGIRMHLDEWYLMDQASRRRKKRNLAVVTTGIRKVGRAALASAHWSSASSNKELSIAREKAKSEAEEAIYRKEELGAELAHKYIAPLMIQDARNRSLKKAQEDAEKAKKDQRAARAKANRARRASMIEAQKSAVAATKQLEVAEKAVWEARANAAKDACTKARHIGSDAAEAAQAAVAGLSDIDLYAMEISKQATATSTSRPDSMIGAKYAGNGKWYWGELLQAGSAVEGNFHGDGKWYRGKLVRTNPDGTYDIQYDDGDRELEVGAEFIRPLQTKSLGVKTIDIEQPWDQNLTEEENYFKSLEVSVAQAADFASNEATKANMKAASPLRSSVQEAVPETAQVQPTKSYDFFKANPKRERMKMTPKQSATRVCFNAYPHGVHASSLTHRSGVRILVPTRVRPGRAKVDAQLFKQALRICDEKLQTDFQCKRIYTIQGDRILTVSELQQHTEVIVTNKSLRPQERRAKNGATSSALISRRDQKTPLDGVDRAEVPEIFEKYKAQQHVWVDQFQKEQEMLQHEFVKIHQSEMDTQQQLMATQLKAQVAMHTKMQRQLQNQFHSLHHSEMKAQSKMMTEQLTVQMQRQQQAHFHTETQAQQELSKIQTNVEVQKRQHTLLQDEIKALTEMSGLTKGGIQDYQEQRVKQQLETDMFSNKMHQLLSQQQEQLNGLSLNRTLANSLKLKDSKASRKEAADVAKEAQKHTELHEKLAQLANQIENIHKQQEEKIENVTTKLQSQIEDQIFKKSPARGARAKSNTEGGRMPRLTITPQKSETESDDDQASARLEQIQNKSRKELLRIKRKAKEDKDELKERIVGLETQLHEAQSARTEQAAERSRREATAARREAAALHKRTEALAVAVREKRGVLENKQSSQREKWRQEQAGQQANQQRLIAFHRNLAGIEQRFMVLDLAYRYQRSVPLQAHQQLVQLHREACELQPQQMSGLYPELKAELISGVARLIQRISVVYDNISQPNQAPQQSRSTPNAAQQQSRHSKNEKKTLEQELAAVRAQLRHIETLRLQDESNTSSCVKNHNNFVRMEAERIEAERLEAKHVIARMESEFYQDLATDAHDISSQQKVTAITQTLAQAQERSCALAAGQVQQKAEVERARSRAQVAQQEHALAELGLRETEAGAATKIQALTRGSLARKTNLFSSANEDKTEDMMAVSHSRHRKRSLLQNEAYVQALSESIDTLAHNGTTRTSTNKSAAEDEPRGVTQAEALAEAQARSRGRAAKRREQKRAP